jgi:hypothetical protein
MTPSSKSCDLGERGLGWDVGLVYYTYEESDYNYPEIYDGLSKDWFKAKLSYSNDFGGDTTSGDTPAFYVEGNATLNQGVTMIAAAVRDEARRTRHSFHRRALPASIS